MKTERNIFLAFILNISFSIFELFGGILTNSVAILSDSLPDLGDAILETEDEICDDKECHIELKEISHHHH